MKARVLLRSALLLLALGAVSVSYAKDGHKAPEYPNAKREAPRIDLRSRRDEKTLQAGFKALNGGDSSTATEDFNKILKDSDSKYAKAMALRGLAQIKITASDNTAAIPLLQQAMAMNSLPNGGYFDTMLTIAQLQAEAGQWKPALTTLQQWMDQGGKQSGSAYALEGNIYYRLNQYPQAVSAMKQALALKPNGPDSWNQLLMASYAGMGNYAEAAKLEQAEVAKHPNDKGAVKNLVTVYLQAKEPAKALQVMADAKARGLYTTGPDYVNLAKMYLYVGQNQDHPKADALQAAQVLEQGLAAKIIEPSYEPYDLLGKAYYLAGEEGKAIDALAKGSPYAKDGELDFLRAQLLIQDDKYSEGRSVMQQALKRGVKRVGAAWQLIGNADLAMHQPKAAASAYERAAKDPETHAAAEKMLAQLHAGKR